MASGANWYNMDDEEMKKFWEEFALNMDSADLNPVDVKIVSSNLTYPMPNHHNPYRGYSTSQVSPTDLDANYPYQEPEVDEQGTYYGYKFLTKHCSDYGCSTFVSPSYTVQWGEDGKLSADRCPSKYHMHGIHFTKRQDNPALSEYYYLNPYQESVLVKCALSGTVVETEQGFRAEHAQIIGVLQDGHWTSYQDYKERTRTDSRRIAEPTWEARFYYGRWQDPDTYFSAGS